MSYEDPNRDGQGQFHFLGMPATIGEQQAAGVSYQDDALSAGLRVRNMRMMSGLDEFTGQPLPTRAYSSAGCSDGSVRSSEDGQCGKLLWTTFKWTVLWPTALFCAGAGLVVAAAWSNNAWRDSGPGRGLSAVALRAIAPSARLAPPSNYLTPQEMARAKSLDAILKAGEAKRLERRGLASSYLCQVNAFCARDAELRSGVFVGMQAAKFLLSEARRGKADAARDACLLPLLTEARVQPLLLSTLSCRDAAAAGSREARELLGALNASGWVRFGRIVELISDAACLEVPSSFCRLSDAPGKLVRAFEFAAAPH